MSKIHALWPDGSYSSKAAKEINKDFWFEIDYKKSISNVIEETIKAYYWIVPIYNNYWWIVEQSVPLLIDNEDILNVCWITWIEINHCLATFNSDLNINDLSKIYSHPQAVKQCTPFLEKTWITNIVETQSTTEWIGLINESEAVICSLDAAKENNMNILNENIWPKNNVTNFAFIANTDYLNKEILFSNNVINKDMFYWIKLLNNFMSSRLIKSTEITKYSNYLKNIKIRNFIELA